MRPAVFASLAILVLPAWAQASDRTGPLLDMLRMSDLVGVMRQEGIGYGQDLAAEFFVGRTPAGWQRTVERIYDADRMEAEVREAFEEEMAGVDLGGLEAFYGAELGIEIVALEISVREAFLDPSIEEAATEEMRLLEFDDDERLAWVKEFSARNDLVDENVVGAMNSNFAFYRGLSADMGAFPMTEEDMLRDVWAQEPEIRTSTEEWLYTYLHTAYSPLEQFELDAYMDMTQTEAGRAMTRALFAAFDVSFVRISEELGAATARYLGSEEL